MRALTHGLSAFAVMLGPASGTADDQILRYYDVCINGRCTGAVPVLAVQSGQWLVDIQALSLVGIDASAWALQHRDGLSFADLAVRFPTASIGLDEHTQSLHIQLPAQAWPEHSISHQQRWSRPAVAPSRMLSVFANYSVRADDRKSIDGYAETGAVFGPWQLRSAFTWDRQGGSRRSRTALEFDQPAKQRRWIVGEQNSHPGDPFGSNARMVGLGVFRAYDLTPGFSAFPGADIRGEMQAPGSVDIYSDGRLVAHEQLAPGPFSIRDLVLPRGLNNLRLVVNDPFAGTYELTDSFYANPRTLRQGLHEFDDRIGTVSIAAGPDGTRRNPLLVSFNHRYGITDAITAGARLESFDNRQNFGASVDLRTPWGTLASAIAQSRVSGDTGTAWTLAYGYERRRIALNLGIRKQSADYEGLLSPSAYLRFSSSIEDRQASISFPIGQSARIVARRLEQRYIDGDEARNTDLDLVWRVARGIEASLRVGRREGTVAPGNEVSLGLRVNLARDSVEFAFRHQGQTDQYQVGAQRSAPSDRGWGYRALASAQAGETSGQADLEWVSPIGRSFVRVSSTGSRSTASVYHSGGLLWAQGQVFATQSGSQGYAIVKTGIANVPVLRENLRVARSNDEGLALVPYLLPYLSNAISVDTSELDANVVFDEERKYTAVPRRGVSQVEFKMRVTRAMQAFLGIRVGEVFKRLSAGQARLDQSNHTAQIGAEGQVYFEDIAAGRHRLFTSIEGRRLTCDLDVPPQGDMAWLGEIECVAE